MKRMTSWRGYVVILRDGSVEGMRDGAPSLHVDCDMLDLADRERFAYVEVREIVKRKPRGRSK